MREFPQSVPNLTEASTNLYELVKGANLVVYPDPDLQAAVRGAVALETSRGWRIAKDKTSARIDILVALAQAALGATKEQTAGGEFYIAAVNLSDVPVRTNLNAVNDGLTDSERQDLAGYQAEQRAREREPF
jgi:phage terminase large subunit-like protein